MSLYLSPYFRRGTKDKVPRSLTGYKPEEVPGPASVTFITLSPPVRLDLQIIIDEHNVLSCGWSHTFAHCSVDLRSYQVCNFFSNNFLYSHEDLFCFGSFCRNPTL